MLLGVVSSYGDRRYWVKNKDIKKEERKLSLAWSSSFRRGDFGVISRVISWQHSLSKGTLFVGVVEGDLACPPTWGLSGGGPEGAFLSLEDTVSCAKCACCIGTTLALCRACWAFWRSTWMEKNRPITNYFPLGIPTSEINMRCGEGCSCCPLVDTWQCTRSDWLIRGSRDFLPQVCLHLQVRQTHKRLYGTYIIYVT